MFFNEITSLTADHLLSHMTAYCALYNINPPLKIETAGLIGGVMTENDLPVYALDCSTKELTDAGIDLNTWMYSGQITGLVGGASASDVNDLVRKHEALCEKFVREHAYFTNTDKSKFTMKAFAYTEVEFTGAANTETAEGAPPYWVAAFRVGLNWLVSEDVSIQHDANN